MRGVGNRCIAVFVCGHLEGAGDIAYARALGVGCAASSGARYAFGNAHSGVAGFVAPVAGIVASAAALRPATFRRRLRTSRGPRTGLRPYTRLGLRIGRRLRFARRKRIPRRFPIRPRIRLVECAEVPRSHRRDVAEALCKLMPAEIHPCSLELLEQRLRLRRVPAPPPRPARLVSTTGTRLPLFARTRPIARGAFAPGIRCAIRCQCHGLNVLSVNAFVVRLVTSYAYHHLRSIVSFDFLQVISTLFDAIPIFSTVHV